ncbi:MAG: internalin A [Porticoccaceae bacterium]
MCLHFQQSRELRRTVFLQNQWVTDAVFRILDDEVVKAERGRFTLQDCDRLWTDDRYENMELELRALMVQFELCYQLPDTGEETWLAPQLFSPSKPVVLNDWAAPGDLVLTYRYAFLPKGLVSRLIVRMHRFVRQPDLCWSQGVLFEQGETQVLVETRCEQLTHIRRCTVSVGFGKRSAGIPSSFGVAELARRRCVCHTRRLFRTSQAFGITLRGAAGRIAR